MPLTMTVTPGKVFAEGELVTTAKLNQLGAPTIVLEDGEFDAVIPDGSVTTAKLAASAVTNAKLGADCVDGTKLADDAVDSEHLADASVDAAHLADASVTDPKVAYADTAVAALEIDWATGYCFRKTLTADDTFTFANASDGKTILLLLIASAADRTPAFPATVEWAWGIGPVAITSGKKALYTFTQVNSTVFGSYTNDHATA